MLRAIVVSSLWAVLTSAVWTGEAKVSQQPAKSPAALKAEIEDLHAVKVAWREMLGKALDGDQ